MIEYENECCDCGLPCLGDSCPMTHVAHYYCDECGEETKLYEYDDRQLCLSCIRDSLEPVN